MYYTTMMRESILDIPRKTLDPEVFDVVVDKGDAQLTPTVRAEILRQSEVYNQWGKVKRVLLIGSILTRHWKSESDIDVTLLFKPTSPEAFEAAKQHSAQSQDTMPLLATAHPLNFYIRNSLIRDGWDNIYDVTGDGWVKRSPELVAKSAEDYLHQFDRLIKDIDLEKGELYRDLIDYAELIELGEADVDDLHTRVAEKAEEIDDQVKKLVMIHKALHRMRKSAFERPLTADEVREYKTKNLLPVSVLYKLLERYHYLKLLKELEKVLKAADGEISTAKDVKGVEKAVKADGVVEELITELTTAAAAGPYEVPLGATPVGRQQRRRRKRKFNTSGYGFLHGVTNEGQNMKRTLLTLALICFAAVGYAGTYIDGVPAATGGGGPTNLAGWSAYPATSGITPSSSNTFDLGSPSKPFRSGYFSTNSLWMGDYRLGVNSNGSLTYNDNPVVSTSGTSIAVDTNMQVQMDVTTNRVRALEDGTQTWYTVTQKVATNDAKYLAALTNGQSGVNFGSLTVGGHAVLTNEALWLASVAYNITSGNTNNWSTAFGWGNHATNGYATTSITNGFVTYPVMTNWVISQGYLTNEALWLASVAYRITAGDTQLWHKAVSDGVSATAGVARLDATVITNGGNASASITIPDATASNQPVTLAQVRSLVSGNLTLWYANTPITQSGYTNNSSVPTNAVFKLDTTLGAQFTRTNASVAVGSYYSATIYTSQTFTTFNGGSISIERYVCENSAGDTTIKEEVYRYEPSSSNWIEWGEAAAPALVPGGTVIPQKLAWSVPVTTVATNVPWMVGTRTKRTAGTGSPTLIVGGGSNYPSRVSLLVPTDVITEGYVKQDGTSPMTGNLNLGGNAVSNGTWLGNPIGGEYVAYTRTNITYTHVLTAATVTNTTIVLPYPGCNVSWGKMYATATNTISRTATLTFYANNDYKGSNAYWRANMPIVVVPITNSSVIGATRLQTADGSGFAVNDLVYTCDSNEFARVSAITNNDLYLEDALVYPHGTTSSVSKVSEFGGFTTIDWSATSNAWHKISFTNVVTQTIKMDYSIRR